MRSRYDVRRTDEASRRPPGRRTRRLLALVTALLVLTPVAASAVPIEGFATYDPQTNCSPNAKPGTTKLSTWLQAQYPGSGSLGISRSCKDGGVSEHKEGRAFDWAVNVSSARDRAYVADYFAQLFATDAEGNTDALARRMGIMYLIWDDHIYSSYYGFRARDYKACKVLSTCGDTLRHRNHVHISLSRAGGNGTTSWYTGATTVPAAAPDRPDGPDDRPATAGRGPVGAARPQDQGRHPRPAEAEVRHGRALAEGSREDHRLQAAQGIRLPVTASGLFGYGTPSQVADASCRWSPTTRSWTPYPGNVELKTHGSLNLLVNGRRISASTCTPTHVYAMTVKPSRTGPLRLQVANKPTGASGALRVLVSRTGTDVGSGVAVAPTLAAAPVASPAKDGSGLVTETVAVPAASGTVSSTQAVEAGAAYRITVAGAAALGGGVQTDGRCVLSGGTWWPQASLDRWNPAQGHGRLFVDGVPLETAATDGGSAVRDPVAHRDVHRHPQRTARPRALGPAGPHGQRRPGDGHRPASDAGRDSRAPLRPKPSPPARRGPSAPTPSP